MASWKDRGRRAHTLQCKADKRIQKANSPQRDQQAAEKTEKGRPEERSFDPPSGDPPRHPPGDEAGRDDQEDPGTNDRRELPEHLFHGLAATESPSGGFFLTDVR